MNHTSEDSPDPQLGSSSVHLLSRNYPHGRAGFHYQLQVVKTQSLAEYHPKKIVLDLAHELGTQPSPVDFCIGQVATTLSGH